MTTREEIVAACLALPGTYEDYPFHDDGWAVMRHGVSHKSFVFIHERQGHIWVNVKAEPAWGDFWKNTFPAVVPAYHMNKEHWVSVILDGSMADEDILRLVADSYRLTGPKEKVKGAPAKTKNATAKADKTPAKEKKAK